MKQKRFNIVAGETPEGVIVHRVVEYREDGICLGGRGSFFTYQRAQEYAALLEEAERPDTSVTI